MTSRRSPAISPKYHDFIEFTFPVKEALFAKLSPLYLQGLSLLEISDQTGIPKTTIRNELIRGGISLRPLRSETLAQSWRKRSGKSNTKPPYGFCYLLGNLTKHPKEYPVLLLIHSRWKSGTALNSFATLLNGKRIPSPMNKDWSWSSINNIVGRFITKTIISKGGKLELR